VSNRTGWICIAALFCIAPLQGAYLFKDGHFINEKDLATGSVEEHYQAGIDALKAKQWDSAYQQFHIIIVSFSQTSLAQDAQYYLAVALYEMNDLDVANREFSTYLQKSNDPSHIEDVYRYKLAIAEKLSGGARTHLLGFDSLPKLQTDRSSALEIFDEVASALPNHDLAATALLEKAQQLRTEERYNEAIEVYHTAIRRFPGSAFSLQAFLGISSCYVDVIKRQPQNVDAITLAEINLKQVNKDFPQAQELASIDADFVSIREMYVQALYETAQLYERMSHPKASVLYYHLAETAYPTSSIAAQCRARKKELSQYADELHLPTS
jgi:outer membrane protein assembly factor BamD (BamD/ComL family)